MSWLFSFKNCLIIVLLVNIHSLRAATYFDFNADANLIYQKITMLRLSEAQELATAMKTRESNNLIIHHLENYHDFFTLFISENEADYKRMERNRNYRLRQIQASDAEDSPYYLFVQAEIRLHWALLRLKFGEYLPALTDINRAHKLLLANQEKFPNFLPNKRDLAILHAAVGTVPDEYRWALDLLSSLEGTVEQGKREIEAVIDAAEQQDFPFLQETKVLYAYLLLHLDSNPQAAWDSLSSANLNASSSPLHAFVLANIAMRTGRNEQAIEYLSLRPRGANFSKFSFLDYMLGVAKLRKLDTRGKIYLQSFLVSTEGRHYIKEAYQKIAWAELLDDNMAGYHSNMQNVIQHGHTATGGDQNALKEARSNSIPTIVLLKARLLFDGSYFSRAKALLENQSADDFSNPLNQLEYLYRFGRILHGLKNYPEALNYYNRTIAVGRENTAFYACNAALQAGFIEENRNRKPQAKSYFEICLGLHPQEYKSSLHQQAKAGLNRLGF